MLRLFDVHRIRRTKELDGMWSFHMDGIDKEYKFPVPGCFEQHLDFMNYRGAGEYSRQVYSDCDGNLRLEFKGVSHTADVYFDGEKITHHYNAFTPFDAVVKNVKKGIHELRVRVDNTFSEDSALHIPNDYYTYGGITRPVSMEQIDDVYIKRVHFTPYMENDGWHAKIDVVISNISEDSVMPKLGIKLEDEAFIYEVCREDAGIMEAESEITFTCEKKFENIIPWSHKNPKLYLLNVMLYANDVAVDDMIERIGFRTVRVMGEEIYLNEEKLYFKGFNRHEDYAVDGCAVSLQHMAQDVELMKDMNANAVRTCHYPNDERFLDLCDEYGIMVWEENHARGLRLKEMQNPNFERQCADCIEEMIDNHYNHPSIIIWGILNECASETIEGREMYKKQYAQIRNMDLSRPVTSATCRHFTDICLDLPDVVSFNMYSGWYKNCPPDERNNEEIEWIKNPVEIISR